MPNSDDQHELRSLALEFFTALRSVEGLASSSRDQITADYDSTLRAAHERRETALAESRKRHAEVAKAELKKLISQEPPSQHEWTDPRLRPFLDSNGGGIASRQLRIGSIAANVMGRRVRVPLCMDIEQGPCIILLEAGGSREDAVAIFRSVILRYLITIRPTIVGLRCFDGKEHGAAFNGFIQNLPSKISGGVAGTTPKDFDERIAELDARIAFVSQYRLNDQHRTLIGANTVRQGDVENYYILATANMPHGLDEQRIDRLLRTMIAGPRAGVFLVSFVEDAAPLKKRADWDEVSRRAIFINVGRTISVKQADSHVTVDVAIDRAPAEPVRNALCSEISKAYDALLNPVIHVELPSKDRWWQGGSDHELFVELGRGNDGRPQMFRLNEERLTGALIAGSSGTGKTNLLRLIITGLILRYTPKQLHLYLFDLKGIDFNVFDEVNVPHIRMIVGEISQELGLAALKNFRELLTERKKLIAAASVQKLSEYNAKNPAAPLPRVLIVIDEFQILFEGDVMASREAAAIIILLMKQGRSYGIHLIMASQNLAPETTPKDVKSNCPCRIALSFNSPTDYRMVFESEPPAEMLPVKWGATIQTTESGFARFSIPYLAVSELREQLKALSTFAGQRGLLGDKGAFISGTTTADLGRNQRLSRMLDGVKEPGEPTLWLGDTVALGGYACFQLPSQRDSNFLIITQRRNFSAACSMAVVSAISVLAHSPNNRCFIFGANTVSESDGKLIHSLVRALPSRCFAYPDDDLSGIDLIAKEISGGGLSVSNSARTALFFPAMDRCREIDAAFRSLYSPPKAFATQQLPPEQAKKASLCDKIRGILENGPSAGFHAIVVVESLSAIERQTLARFNLCAATCLTDSDSKAMFGGSEAAALDDNFAVGIDRSTQTEPTRFRPYSNIAEHWFAECMRKLQ